MIARPRTPAADPSAVTGAVTGAATDGPLTGGTANRGLVVRVARPSAVPPPPTGPRPTPCSRTWPRWVSTARPGYWPPTPAPTR